jgi:hypothetical protein
MLPFARCASLMELCLLGNIALRAGKFRWDSAERKILDNKRAARLLRKEYRDGWRLIG